MDAGPQAEPALESLLDLAREAATLKLLAERVTAAQRSVKARTQAALDLASRRDGVERIAATLPGGETVATISLRRGETGPVVVDEDALARWVRRTYPDEEWTTTEVVRRVKPWKAAELLAEMEAAGAPQIADRATGEVHTVPGVVVRPTRARTHALTWRKGGREATAAAWRTGQLTGQLAALTAGGDAEDAPV
ncbi:hypothetical protein ACFCV9_32575 [Streptomyces sp. NPDC056367]|uniref:hypothetical protein n=1 Tax=unclassified Streptomyces TaxID=2593676 RepID=UPI0035DA4AED